MVDRTQVADEYIPDRGDIAWFQFSPQAEHEQAGRRPALVVSAKRYNSKTGLALMCPITSKAKGYPFEVMLPDEFPVSGVILADQVKSLDWRMREAHFACEAPARVVAEVLDKLEVLLS